MFIRIITVSRRNVKGVHLPAEGVPSRGTAEAVSALPPDAPAAVRATPPATPSGVSTMPAAPFPALTAAEMTRVDRIMVDDERHVDVCRHTWPGEGTLVGFPAHRLGRLRRRPGLCVEKDVAFE